MIPNTVQINTISPYHFVVYLGGIGLGAKNLCKNVVCGGGDSLPLTPTLLLFVLLAVSPFHRFVIQYDVCDDELLHRMLVSFKMLSLHRDEQMSDLDMDLAEMLVMDSIISDGLNAGLILTKLFAVARQTDDGCSSLNLLMALKRIILL